VDPSSQTSGIVKWGVTLAAGYLAARFKLDPLTVAGALTGVATLVWQIIHRKKVAAALAATAAMYPTTDPAKISAVAAQA
jgi:hypothetical protein